MVIGRPYEIRFRESARRLFPELKCLRPGIRANGKFDLELDTEELGVPVALRSLAQHVVFIERSDVNRLEKCSVEWAVRKLEETICYGSHQTRLEQRQTLAHFAGLPIWRLYYSDLDWAESTLESILDNQVPC